jgi:hypothetical protein
MAKFMATFASKDNLVHQFIRRLIGKVMERILSSLRVELQGSISKARHFTHNGFVFGGEGKECANFSNYRRANFSLFELLFVCM